MSRNTDWIVKDEQVRKAYEEENNKHISYGHFRALHPELVPSKTRKIPKVVKNAKHYRKGGPCQIQLTDEDDKKLTEEYINGKSEYELAADFGVTVQTVRLHLKKMNAYTAKRAPKDWTEKEIEALRTLYLKGESLGYIADVLNRSLNSVRAKIAATGLSSLKKKNRCEAATSSAASKN